MSTIQRKCHSLRLRSGASEFELPSTVAIGPIAGRLLLALSAPRPVAISLNRSVSLSSPIDSRNNRSLMPARLALGERKCYALLSSSS